MNWKNSLVAIFTPTIGSAGDEGVYGTAFPISHDLLLTAHHVLFPQDRHETRPTMFKWWYSGENWTEFSHEDMLIGQEWKDLDVALIRLPRPQSLTEFCHLTEQKPTDHKDWSSEGFPAAARLVDTIRPSSVRGKVMARSDYEDFFQITVDSGLKTDDSRGWGGASGMPIVMETRVIGVAVRVETEFQGTILAAPVWKIWNDIKTHLVPADRTCEFKEETAQRLKLFFAQKNALKAALESSHEFKSLVVNNQGVADASVAAENFMDSAPHDLFLALYFVSKKLEELANAQVPLGESESSDYRNALPLFMRVVDYLAPYILGVSKGRTSINHEASIREIPVATQTMAEIVMAAEGERDASFWPRNREPDMPRGQAQLPLTVEFSEKGHPMVAMIKDAFLREYLGGEEIPIDSTSIKKATGSLLAQKYDPDNGRLKRVEIALKGIVERREALPFLAIKTPKEESQFNALKADLEMLRDEVPSLPILLLSCDEELDDAEFAELQHFTKLIPMAKGTS